MTTEGGQTSRFERICTTDGQSLPLVVLRPFVLLRSISLHFEYVNKFGFPLLLGGSLSLSLSTSRTGGPRSFLLAQWRCYDTRGPLLIATLCLGAGVRVPQRKVSQEN